MLAILERLKHIAGAATVLIYRIYEILTKCTAPDLGYRHSLAWPETIGVPGYPKHAPEKRWEKYEKWCFFPWFFLEYPILKRNSLTDLSYCL